MSCLTLNGEARHRERPDGKTRCGRTIAIRNLGLEVTCRICAGTATRHGGRVVPRVHGWRVGMSWQPMHISGV